MEASIPYFDASVEEILRLSGAFSFLFRQATRDTTLLGHYVPKGTHMLVLLNGPDTTQPGITGVDEMSRSVSSQKQAVKNGIRAWDPTTVSEFQPERWLVESNEGALSFDSQAGPTLPFSGGLRGCFGRNHAYLQVKITFTMLVWRFEMLRCAPGLSSYEGLEKVTRGPKQCYVRLKTLPMH
jgi:cytochrome P450